MFAAASLLHAQNGPAQVPAANTVATALSAREIVQRSVERDRGNFARFNDYTFEQLVSQQRLNKDGSISSVDTELNEVLILGGRPYSRLLEKNGKPLSEKDAAKEQKKLDKEATKRAKETPEQRAKIERERLKEREYAQEIPDAFDFTLLGEETRDGLPVWKIRAEPRPDFKPRSGDAKVLQKVRGTMWIDQAGYQWVAADIEVIETISWGWFLLRIPPGAVISFSQMRVNDEVWLPKEVHVRADARLGLIRTLRFNIQVGYRNYRKFATDSQILSTEELPAGLPVTQ